jgi:CTP:molybdopterin cytidylyltransferase MocA
VVVGVMCVVLFAGLSTKFRWKSVVVRLSGRSVITRVLPMRAPEREIVGLVTVQSRRWFAAIFGALICPLNKG